VAEPLAPIPLLRAGHPRRQAVRAGGRVEIVTVAWMSVEAVVSIGVGLLARSVLLTAFGIDSVIELLARPWWCAVAVIAIFIPFC
jgi:hypothetical protein